MKKIYNGNLDTTLVWKACHLHVGEVELSQQPKGEVSHDDQGTEICNMRVVAARNMSWLGVEAWTMCKHAVTEAANSLC